MRVQSLPRRARNAAARALLTLRGGARASRLARRIPFGRTVRYVAQTSSGARREGLRWAVETVRDYPRWMRSQRHGSPLEDRFPWITFGAERHLQKILPRVSRAFEFGSGGSTLYLSAQVPGLVTVEHDPEWSGLVAARLADRPGALLELHPPTLGEDAAHRSTDERYLGMSFRDYASAIDPFPDRHFDLIVIDGRARDACFRHALPKLRPHGWLVLDNSDRIEYAEIVEVAKARSWTVNHYFGPGPYIPNFWRTTIWRSGNPLGQVVSADLRRRAARSRRASP